MFSLATLVLRSVQQSLALACAYIVSFEPDDNTRSEIQRNLTASSIALSSKINTIDRLADL